MQPLYIINPNYYFSEIASKSSLDATTIFWNCLTPVPAGIKCPTITFSFNPNKLSTLPANAASFNTLVVSWKEAAEINDLV